MTQPPFDDREARKSLALAMEVDKQLQVTHKGLARRAAGFVPPGMFGYNSALEPSGFDSETTRETLRNSRYGGPEGLPPITWTGSTTRNSGYSHGGGARTIRIHRISWRSSFTVRAQKTGLPTPTNRWTSSWTKRRWSRTQPAVPTSTGKLSASY